MVGRRLADSAYSALIGRAHFRQASNPFQLAVTGGTGRLQNARSQATVQTMHGKGNPAKVTLSLLP